MLREKEAPASSAPGSNFPSGTLSAPPGLCVCGGKKRRGYWSGYRDDFDDEGEEYNAKGVVKALKGNDKGMFSENEVRKVLRGLGREERMRLSVYFVSCPWFLKLILSGCLTTELQLSLIV